MYIKKLPQFSEKEIERFWAKVQIRDDDECWEWQASLSTTGYGQVMRGKKGSVQSFRAHRIAYFLFYNIDPVGYLICHRCANPLCCNPHHLYMGTHTDNMMDALADGARGELKPPKVFNRTWGLDKNIGEKHHNAKLDADKVRDIRVRLANKEPHRSIAKVHEVGKCAIDCIARGVTWKHVI